MTAETAAGLLKKLTASTHSSAEKGVTGFMVRINDRLVKEALNDARLPTAVNRTHWRATIETKAMFLSALIRSLKAF